MRHRRRRSPSRIKGGGALVGALVSGALTTATFCGAPRAEATCLSAFTLSLGDGCQSSLGSIAIGIGPGAIANATSVYLGGAFAIGNAQAVAGIGVLNFATAIGNGAEVQNFPATLSAAMQIGPGLSAVFGTANLAIGVGGGAATSGVGNLALQLGSGLVSNIGFFNTAVGISTGGTGPGTNTNGFLHFALNISGDSQVSASGGVGIAANIGGNGNVVTAGLGPGNAITLSEAVNFFGNNNTVTATGPFAIAASLLQNGATVTKSGPLFNINGVRLGPATSIRPDGQRPAAATTARAAKAGTAKAANVATAAGVRPRNR